MPEGVVVGLKRWLADIGKHSIGIKPETLERLLPEEPCKIRNLIRQSVCYRVYGNKTSGFREQAAINYGPHASG